MQRLFSSREKIIFFIAVTAIIFAAGFNFLILPVYSNYEKFNNEIKLNWIKLNRYFLLLKQKEEILAKFGGALPTKESGQLEDASLGALTDLQNLAKGANIKIKDFRQEGSSAQKKTVTYREILINLRTEGTLEAYIKFIYDLENSLFLLRINKMQLSVKPNSPTLEGSFLISQLTGLD